ncbi:tetratricopeptide repeat protein [Stenotrophomonas sp. ISL-67]|uniref:tetratricopeptide repeat protein n=1 Tax=Stenotrophomonas sp. ISL-67 TaxID=2819171 RepID=UPI001BE783DF|nr:tetratricopeptide repeat protein [Stenotrophomonas sp. ISL-67]MBT2767191.1 tetratricopeptide repeat protein [Stenotrophomonas sp. ISL-67]
MQDTIIQALRRNAAEEAAQLAREWIQAEPEQPQAHRWLALALQQQGQYDSALESLQRGLALAPDSAELHLQHAGLLLALRQFDAANTALDRTAELNPNELSAYLMQAHLALSRNDVDEAERITRTANRVEEDNPEVVALQGMIALRRNDAERALALLSAASQALPNDPRILYTLGFAYLGKDMLAFAEQAFRRVLELNPGITSLQGLLIQLALRQGNTESAAATLNQVLSQPETDTPAMRRLAGELALQAGQPLQALEHLLPVLEQWPADRQTLQLLLMAWQRLGREAQARETLDAALATHPREHNLWLARLSIDPVGGADAAAVADRWIEAMPDHMAALETRMRVHDMADEPDAAEAIARRIIALEPGRASGETLLVDTLLARDPAAAVAHVEQLVLRAPPEAQPGLRAWLGSVQDRAAQPEAALATWTSLHASEAPNRLPLPPQAKAPLSWPDLGEVAAGTSARPMFVWGAPGSGVERVIAAIAAASQVLRGDRFGANPPDDAFQSYHALQDLSTGKLTPEALIAQWRGQLPARGLADANVIDWLLWWDNALLWALRPQLPEGRLLLALRDPRDMLLEWLAHGAPAPFAVTSVNEAAEWLARALTQIATLHEQDLYPHALVRLDEIGNDPVAMAEHLGGLFGVSFPPAQTLGPARFPAGYWRQYNSIMAAAFAQLTPVAVRLGYPEA